MASGSAAFATDYSWNVVSGNFQSSSNWNPTGVPGDGLGDRAFIDNGGTATLSAFHEPQLSNVDIGSTTGTSGTLVLNAGSDLLSDKIRIGLEGSGTTTVNNGIMRALGGSLFIGGQESSSGSGVGILNISGSSTALVTSGDDVQFGANGTGTLNMSGGLMQGVYTVVGKFGTGVWNHSGGVYDETGGDIEIGDGGRPDQSGVSGPRQGTINLTGGVIRVHDHMGIGNRKGSGTVNISGGALLANGIADSTIYLGRGMDWGAGQGGPVTMRVTGDDAIIAANGNFVMNTSQVASSATLIAEITGSTHTPIRVTGNADIGTGSILKVELNGYAPVSGNSWTILEAGADITADKAAINAIVTGGGFTALDDFAAGPAGTLNGTFATTDFSLASLAPGLSWNVSYASNKVVLSITGTATGVPGDYNGNNVVDAADYTEWRDNLGGPANSLPNRDPGNSGVINQADYTFWKNNFGNPGSGGGSLSASAVPEPTTTVWLVISAITTMFVARPIRRETA
jgi:hypothetical protein